MPTKIKSRQGKTMMKARRSKLRKRGADAEEGAGGRRNQVQAQAARLVPIMELLGSDNVRQRPPELICFLASAKALSLEGNCRDAPRERIGSSGEAGAAIKRHESTSLRKWMR